MATDTIQVIDTDYETIQSLIYSNFINTSKDLENITKNIKEYVTKLGFPFNEYLAYTMSKELPLQPAKELIYNEFTAFENKMNILHKINEKKLDDFCVNIGRNMGTNWNHVLKNYNETKLEYEKKMLKIDEYRKKMIEVNTNHIKSMNKMKDDYHELEQEIKKKYGSVSELHKVSTKFRKEIQVSILESIKVDINKVIQKSGEAEILTNIITKKDIQDINSYITERLTGMENYFANKDNEIDKIKFLLDEREKIIQNKLEDKLIPLVKIKNNYGYITITDNFNLENLPENLRLRFYTTNNIDELKDKIKQMKKTIISEKIIPFESNNDMITYEKAFLENVSDEDIIKSKSVDNYKELIKLHNEIKNECNFDLNQVSEHQWYLKKLIFKNLFIYGENKENKIIFDNKNGVIGILGNNAIGKSTIINIIIFALFDKISTEYHNSNVK